MISTVDIPEIGANGFDAFVYSNPTNGIALQRLKHAHDPNSQLFRRIMNVVTKKTEIVRCNFKFDKNISENKLILKIPPDWLSLREMFMPDEDSKACLREAYYKALFESFKEIFEGSPFTEIVVHLGQYSFQIAKF